jgi:Nickel responsive protein SCO4226-like
MPQYLVEVYHSKTRHDEALLAAERARDAAEEVASGGVAVRYVRSHLLRDDETCLYLFEAPSAGEVREACRRAGIDGDRIVEVADIMPPPQHTEGRVTPRCAVGL